MIKRIPIKILVFVSLSYLFIKARATSQREIADGNFDFELFLDEIFSARHLVAFVLICCYSYWCGLIVQNQKPRLISTLYHGCHAISEETRSCLSE